MTTAKKAKLTMIDKKKLGHFPYKEVRFFRIMKITQPIEFSILDFR